MVSYLRGPYNFKQFWRNRQAYQISAGIHFAHGKQHDVLLLKIFGPDPAINDLRFDVECLEYQKNPPRTEPTMELFAPFTARVMWQLFRAIDWTHIHHEQTYDILADQGIPWNRKKEWTDRAVDYYLRKLDIPRSSAPLDVTMRRAAVMMKPYFTGFRNNYPLSNNFFYAAHWWHPAIYEAQMLGGNGPAQEAMIRATDRTFYDQVLVNRPKRMLLSREIMPKYSRLSPESANIFDNLHMLHGIAYDILAYDGWTIEQKRAELYRVIRAMSYHPGDEQLARKFTIERPDVDPRVYEDWMQTSEGDMNRIMKEMFQEMMPMMMPGGMSPAMHQAAMDQLRKKLAPGMEPGEIPGSLADALTQVMPGMHMMPESMEPGATPQQMVDLMLSGWRDKYGSLPDVAPMPMDRDPVPPVDLVLVSQGKGE